VKYLFGAVALAVATAAPAEPLTVHNGRLFIATKVAGVPTEALLDSGAEMTLIDPAFAAKAKLPEGQPLKMKGSGGEAMAHIVPDVTLEVLGVTLHPEAVVVTDLKDISTRLLRRPTQVVIGREIFDAARLRIDLRKSTIQHADAKAMPPGKRLALTAHAGIEAIPVAVNGVNANAEFDLGNGSDVMVSRAMVKKLGLKVTGQRLGGGIGGELKRDTVVLDRLQLAGKTFRNVPASIDDQPSANDLNVGTSILRNFVITTDFHGRAVWLQPQGR
jgi:predicted aspartyl protease